MNNNFNSIKTRLQRIQKTNNGYIIYRFSSTNKYIINLNLNTRKIELRKSI
jgi:hypothetical protein